MVDVSDKRFPMLPMGKSSGFEAEKVGVNSQKRVIIPYYPIHDAGEGDGERGIVPRRSLSPFGNSSSLDTNRQNVPKSNSWSKKQKRAFHRILSGFHRADGQNQKIRFMTLTTAKYEDYRRLNADFQVLRKRAKRKLGLKIDYFKIKTNEGFGVLHCLTKGGFLPQRWLSQQWHQIHGAKIVDIRGCFGKSKRLTNYLVKAFYSSKQTFERMSWSWGWVFKGFVGYWETFKYRGLAMGLSMKDVVRRWKGFLGKPVLFYTSLTLDGG